jgi:inosine-uridine nucleoside N-ribohydrolase
MPSFNHFEGDFLMKAAMAICIGFGLLAVLVDGNTSVFAAERIPVIYDTDIGDDIDDTWALSMLLKSPQFDLKMVSTSCHNAHARARLVAKLLTVAGRTDIPIALGPGGNGKTRQDEWCKDFQLDQYPGTVHEDGPQAVIDLIHNSKQPITIIAVGPLQSLSAALQKDPSIAPKAHFIGMHGSVYKGYGGSSTVSAEYNVRRDAAACRRVLSAPWKSAMITPLDTCGIVHLDGDRFKTLKESNDRVVKALLENYRIWAKKKTVDELTRSSTLFDTVAIYLGYPGPKELIKLEPLSIIVTDDGYTRVDPAGAKMAVATSWNDLDGYRDLLVKVLTGPMPGH